MQNMARVSTATAGSVILGVAVGPRQHKADQLSAEADVIRAVSGLADGICPPPRKSWSWPHQPHPASTWPHIQEQRAAEIYDEVAQRSLELRFLGFTEDSHTQRRPVRNWIQGSARPRGSGARGCTQSSQTAHPCYDPRWSHSWSATAALGSKLPGSLQGPSVRNPISYRRPVARARLPQVTLSVGRVCGQCPHASRLHHQRADKTWQQSVGRGQCRSCGSFLDPQLEHGEPCSTAEATRGHYACVHAVVCGLKKVADPGITTEPRGLTASQSRPTDIFTTSAVPGRSAAQDVRGFLQCSSSTRRRSAGCN